MTTLLPTGFHLSGRVISTYPSYESRASKHYLRVGMYISIKLYTFNLSLSVALKAPLLTPHFLSESVEFFFLENHLKKK